MKIYDFILGKSVAPNYIETQYINRFERDASIASTGDLVTIIMANLTSAFEKLNTIPTEIDMILDQFEVIKVKLARNSDIITDNPKSADNPINMIRELLADLAFMGYECYLVERNDLEANTEVESGTRAYLIDENDNLFHNLNRVSEGYCLVFDISQQASLPNVIIQFLQSVIKFSEVTNRVIGLNALIKKFEALQATNSGWRFDISDIHKFLKDYGYRFIVAM